MTRPRGRLSLGLCVTLDVILDAALSLLDEDVDVGLIMRAVAARHCVTPMSLYHHVSDRAGLLRALSDGVYSDVPPEGEELDDAIAALRTLLTCYHDLVVAYPRLTLAIFTEPDAFAGATRALTDRLEGLLATRTPAYLLWRDILVGHAHGSGLAPIAARGGAARVQTLRLAYRAALNCLLAINGGNDVDE
jgi:AcrR family transcriptional regulator